LRRILTRLVFPHPALGNPSPNPSATQAKNRRRAQRPFFAGISVLAFMVYRLTCVFLNL
jgi:hypothetical protein